MNLITKLQATSLKVFLLKPWVWCEGNDIISIFDGITGEWYANIMSVSKEKIALKVQKKIRDFETQPDIWLIFSPIRQSRMSTAIQKATEIGVSKIIPCITEYTNIKNINLFNFLFQIALIL